MVSPTDLAAGALIFAAVQSRRLEPSSSSPPASRYLRCGPGITSSVPTGTRRRRHCFRRFERKSRFIQTDSFKQDESPIRYPITAFLNLATFDLPLRTSHFRVSHQAHCCFHQTRRSQVRSPVIPTAQPAWATADSSTKSPPMVLRVDLAAYRSRSWSVNCVC